MGLNTHSLCHVSLQGSQLGPGLCDVPDMTVCLFRVQALRGTIFGSYPCMSALCHDNKYHRVG